MFCDDQRVLVKTRENYILETVVPVKVVLILMRVEEGHYKHVLGTVYTYKHVLETV